MYNENSFQNYIFWLKVRRVFFMVIFSIVGALVGIALSEFLVNILLFEAFFRTIIITVSTLLFFSISLLITANTGKEVQDGYWKIAVLRKLTVISKKLDNLDNSNLAENTSSKSTVQKEPLEDEIQEEILESTVPENTKNLIEEIEKLED